MPSHRDPLKTKVETNNAIMKVKTKPGNFANDFIMNILRNLNI